MDDVQLYRGDCLEVLRTLPAGCVDAVVTDPPYGIGYESPTPRTGRGSHSAQHKDWGTIAGDDRVRGEWLGEAVRLLKDGGALYLCTRWDVEPDWRREIRSAGLTLKQRLTWWKRVHGVGDLRGTYAPNCEDVLFATKGRHLLSHRPSMLLDAGCVPTWQRRHHPHQKPTKLPRLLIEASVPSGGTVLDPFMGSGTTGAACVQTGRKFIGVELDKGYFQIARKRIKAARREAVAA